jgi:hypothetical protein
VTPPPRHVQLQLQALDRVTIKAGSDQRVGARVDRQGFPGRIQLRVEGLPPGVTGHPVFLAAGKDEAELRLSATAEVQPGEREVTVLAVGDGVEARQTFSLVVQTVPQLVPPAEVRLRAGRTTITVPVRVERRGHAGPVTLQCQDLPAAVRAEAAVLPPGQELVNLTLTAPEDAKEAVTQARLRANLGDQSIDASIRVVVKQLVFPAKDPPLVQQIGPKKGVNAVAFAPNGSSVAWTGVDGTIRSLELADKKQALLSKQKGAECRVAYSPDSKYLVSGGNDAIVRVWIRKTGQLVLRLVGHTSAVLSVAWSPDGKTILAGGKDGLVLRWDLPQRRGSGGPVYAFKDAAGNYQEIDPDKAPLIGQPIRGLPGPVTCLAYAPNSTTAVAAGANHVAILDITGTGRLIRLDGHRGVVTACAFSRDGRWIATGGADRTVHLWDPATGQERRSFGGHQDSVLCVAFSPDGRRVLSGSADRTLRLWDTETGEEVARCTGHADKVQDVAFAPDGKTFLSGSLDGTVRLWQMPP